MNWSEYVQRPAGIIFGVFRAVLMDPDVFLMAVLGVAIGFLLGSVWAGLVGFLTPYVCFRMTNQYIETWIKVKLGVKPPNE